MEARMGERTSGMPSLGSTSQSHATPRAAIQNAAWNWVSRRHSLHVSQKG